MVFLEMPVKRLFFNALKQFISEPIRLYDALIERIVYLVGARNIAEIRIHGAKLLEKRFDAVVAHTIFDIR